jgi:hypothetical protein
MAKEKHLELLERLLEDWEHCAHDDEYGGLSPIRKRALKRYRKALDELNQAFNSMNTK